MLTRFRIVFSVAILCGMLSIWGPRALAEEGEVFDSEPPLRIEPELNHLLDRAKQFADEGQYNHATTLWQKVLEDSGDTLIRDKEYLDTSGRAIIQTYLSMTHRVERDILQVSAAGLRIYRISADPDAKSLLADGADNEEAALTEVVRRYFLSSHGDDAAYKLGCILLDRYDFVGAARLFQKIVGEHPDPSVPLGEVWLRLAVASARVGDFSTAEHALDQIDRVPGSPDENVIAMVRKDIEQSRNSSQVGPAQTHEWSMIGGGPNRAGYMKKLPGEVTESALTKAWEYRFDIDFTTRPQNAPPAFLPRKAPSDPIELASGSFNDLVSRWTKLGWLPSGHLLMADGKIILKTLDRLTCWDAAGSDDVVWASAWSNEFQLDESTQTLHKMLGNQLKAGFTAPFSKTEVQLFGDRVHQSMSIANDTVYSIEGLRVGNGLHRAARLPQQRINLQYGTVPRRARSNYLAAYDLKTGKAKWHRPEQFEENPESELGFMAAPVPFAHFLLVPVTEGGAIWLYALSAEDGKPVWKTFLSDEPSGGCAPWSPVGVTLEGRDAYVVCGTGVMFAVDAVSGDVRFAVRYHRHGTQNAQVTNRLGRNTSFLQLNGWDDDIAIPFGRSLVIMASDHNWLFAVDRRTGEFLWKSPRKPFDHAASYFMGATPDGGYIVGGKNVVRRYDIPSGRLIWEHEIEDSFGRGIVTEDAIYVPVKDKVIKLQLKDGTEVNWVAVDTKMKFNKDELVEPIGSLFSDGKKLWVLAPNGIYALTNPDQERTARRQN